ncbi:hypothetical protein [Pseudomonas aeruginosa]|uniref:hypothetical protein n=1 Tax=Pseudomonas aeruginosa TaxID=287 RepID=UPI0004D893AC|nr:hypothetical protein [Pseudomonas aeruginosa]KEA17077.1 hypothetical protein BH78_29665 [Pseudomonas aeruginosa C1913C]KSE46861.1 hypothetical protein AO917_18150 [Pseudomonas aeruginosa]QYE94913.1 hypothetical protein KZ797_07735 [Pseudomonas aeruginosa]TEM03440.1 hypothetical protein IPC168_10890 [Pseudomonas aeruginosa]TEO54368.1 hypothetical protein IPC123_15645 [Pseudomonas aeruginosa]
MSAPLAPTQSDRPLRRLFILMTLLVAGLFVLAFIVTFVGIHLLGGIENWQQWLDDHAGHFFVWRLCLYATVLTAWPWARRRRLARDPRSRQQLRLIEVFGVLSIVLFEASNWLRLY